MGSLLLRLSAMGINLTSYRFERYEASPSQSRQKVKERETIRCHSRSSSSESNSSSSSSESSDSDACQKKFKQRERTHHSRSRESSFLNAPFCLHYHVPTPSRHEVKRGKHAYFDKLPSPKDDPSSLSPFD